MYNLNIGGQQIKNLRLSPDVLVGIFTNQITMWDDPRIKADYPGNLPHEPITPVVRSDGSGATAQWTRYMEHTHKAQWDAYCTAINGVSCGDYTEFFPTPTHSAMHAENGSDVVAKFIMSPTGEGSIGYDEYAYAKLNNWPVVKVLNPAGYYTVPTASNVAIALTAAKVRGVDDNTSPDDPNYLQQNLDGVYTNGDKRSYPISSYSYIIVPRDAGSLPPLPRGSSDHGAALSKYAAYILCAGQAEADQLGYSPIPRNLVHGGMLQVAHIPGQASGVDPNTLTNCPNPTFNAAGQLTVLVNAPQPSPCDAKGAPLNCVPGTAGGSSGGSKGGNSGSGGSSGGTNGGATGSSGGAGGNTGSTSADAAGASVGGALGGAGDEGTKRFERQVRHPVLDLQCHQSRPSDPKVEAIIGFVARGLGRIVLRARLESDMPVLRGRDLRRVGFVAADEPSQCPARRVGHTHLQQEMPYHRHSVAAENEALDIVDIKRSRPRRRMPVSSKQTVKQALAFLAHRVCPARLSATRAWMS